MTDLPTTPDEMEDDYQDYQDTSMFDGEEIVKQLESKARASNTPDSQLDARRRAEILREQKRLEQDLADLDSLDF